MTSQANSCKWNPDAYILCLRRLHPSSEEQPAFFHSYEYVRGQRLGVIKLNTVVAERIAKDQLRETLHPRHLPMLIKPKPWLSHDQGGYLYNKCTYFNRSLLGISTDILSSGCHAVQGMYGAAELHKGSFRAW